MHVCILTENDEWDRAYAQALTEAGAKVSRLRLQDALVDFRVVPEADVYLNRYSPSARWRQRAAADACAVACLQHLELSGARVISGTSALALEQSKVAQHAACVQAGFRCPYIAACPRHMLEQAVRQWTPEGTQLIVKPDCGGSGRDVTRAVAGTQHDAEAAPDALHVVQEFVESADGTLTRMEFVKGQLLYALKVRIDPGSYDNCPSDACVGSNCPLQRDHTKFTVDTQFPATREDHAAISNAQTLAVMRGLDILAVEMIKDAKGRWWVVDCNCVNTNYNSAAEQAAGISGVRAVVDLVVHARGPLETGD